MTEIIVAIITGGLALAGVIITNKGSESRTRKSLQETQASIYQQLTVNQAVAKQQMEDLTREVRYHNEFARRIPVIEEQIKVANHRIADLEAFHKPAKE